MTIRIKSLKASAGSGKTYSLSREYLERASRLPGMGEQRPPGCVKAGGQSGLESLLAITFTNKAASEMKERILLFLKQMALGDTGSINKDDFSFLNPDLALDILTRVIRGFSRFNVKTIDSFMTTLLKAFAAEIGLMPDFRLLLSADELHDLAVRDLFEHGTAGSIKALLADVMAREVKAQRSGSKDGTGFDPERIIRKALNRLRRVADRATLDTMAKLSPYDSDGTIAAQLNADVSDFIHRLLAAADGALNGRRVNTDQIEQAKNGTLPTWFRDGASLKELLKKNRELPNMEVFQAELDTLRERARDHEIRQAVERLRSGVRVYQEVLNREEELGRALKQFHIGRMTDTIRRILDDTGASAAFCRLGERYEDYLIDEFQDTSRDQWNALAPLVENTLSEGGRLFLVGDQKQAIYGWRGGDYRLFDTVLLPPGDANLPPDLTAVTRSVSRAEIEVSPLVYNFRSAKRIIQFNNQLFSGLQHPPELPISSGLAVLQGIYKDVEQQLPEALDREGHVHVQTIPLDGSVPVEGWFQERIADVLHRYRPDQVLVLARSSEEVKTISAWMTSLGILFVTEDSLRLFARPVVKGLVNLLSGLNLPEGDHYLAAVTASGWFGRVPVETGTQLVMDWARECRDARDQAHPEPPFRQWLAARDEARVSDTLQLMSGVTSLGSAYEQLCELVRLLELDTGPHRATVDQLLEVVLNIEAEGKSDPGEVLEALYRQLSGRSLTLPETPGAVRVMTIHKAKGLEAEVVILPFLEWRVRGTRGIIGRVTLDGEECLVPITKKLAAVHPDLGRQLEAERAREEVEAVNLLYVALTRAREELYIACPDPAMKKRNSIHIGQVFHPLIEQAGFSFDGTGRFTMGQPGHHEPAPAVDKVINLSGKRRPTDLLVVQDRPELPLEQAVTRFRGTLLHRALQEIQTLPPDRDRDERLRRALKVAFAALGADWSEEVVARELPLLHRLLDRLALWFEPGVRAWNEKEFVAPDGSIIRVDRLVRRDGKWTIIDYKTGRPSNAHRRQLRRYRKVLGPSFQDARLILGYLDSGEVVDVR